MVQVIQERNKFEGLAEALQGIIQGQAARHQRQKVAGEIASINQFLGGAGGPQPQPTTQQGQSLLSQGLSRQMQFERQQSLAEQQAIASQERAIALEKAKVRKPVSVPRGGTLVDPVTGKVVARGDKDVQTAAEVRNEIREISKQVADGDLPPSEGRRQADQLTKVTEELIKLPSPKPGGEADKQANVLRKEWNADPIVKNNEIVSTQVGIIQEAFNEATSAGTSDKSRIASDQALIIAFNKMLDPTSVVRESEFARTPEQVAILNRILATPEKIIKGGIAITDEDRRAILDMANRAADVTARRFNRAFDRFSNLSGRFNVDPQKIFGGITRQEDRGAAEQPGTKIDRNTLNPADLDNMTLEQLRNL